MRRFKIKVNYQIEKHDWTRIKAETKDQYCTRVIRIIREQA
jgi:hypothetical protein